MMIGILGGGQLARMLALAGLPLGVRFRFLDPSPDAPASDAGELIVGEYNDPAALDRFARGLDLVTCEFENVHAACLESLSTRVPVRPGGLAFATGQDREREKTLFTSLSIPVPEFAVVRSLDELLAGVGRIGAPAILKTCRLGYDGKGQARVERADERTLVAAWRAVREQPCVLERMIAFTREASMLCVRATDGAMAFYPLVENVHRGGILIRSIAPALFPPRIEHAAREHARAIAHALDYVGVLAVEFFVEGDGAEGGGQRLIANEIAPRVHNSGHWTIEGAQTSQFENHLRAIMDLPLGATGAMGVSAMVNLIGGIPERRDVLAIEGAHLHLYAKEPRPGRKVGHITLRSASREELERELPRAEAIADATNVLA